MQSIGLEVKFLMKDSLNGVNSRISIPSKGTHQITINI